MSLDLNKLERVVELAGGARRARCPACFETGQDRKGEHLRIYADGKFGCCLYPRDHQHRKRIFALAGMHQPQEIRVLVAGPKPSVPHQTGILGRLGRLFGDSTKACNPIPETVGTLGTPQYSNACARNHSSQGPSDDNELIDFAQPVPSVPAQQAEMECPAPVPSVPSEFCPYRTADGSLVILFKSPAKYHWWNGGQSVAETIAELNERAGRSRVACAESGANEEL